MEVSNLARLDPFTDASRYHRTGLVLAVESASSQLSQVATTLPADRIDWVIRTVELIRPNQRWVSQEPDEVLRDLRALAQESAPFTGRIVEGLDVVLAKWARDDVVRFWTQFVSLAKQPRHAVLAVIPASAVFLHPSAEDLATLENQGRVLRLGDS